MVLDKTVFAGEGHEHDFVKVDARVSCGRSLDYTVVE
jgi:hypothetical protein